MAFDVRITAPGGATRSRGGGVRLPVQTNVVKPSPLPSVPVARGGSPLAFGSGAGFQALGQGTRELAAAANRSQLRKDRINSKSQLREERLAGQEALRTFNEQKDLSLDVHKAEFSNFLKQRRADAIERFSQSGAAKESETLFAERLFDIHSALEGQAFSFGLQAQKAKDDAEFDFELGQVTSIFTQNPTASGLDEAFAEARDIVARDADIMPPGDEISRLAEANERVAMHAVDFHLSTGNIDGASQTLSRPDVWNSLTPQSRRDFNRRINISDAAQREAEQKISLFRNTFGRDPNVQEAMQLIFNIKPTKPSDRERRAEELRQRYVGDLPAGATPEQVEAATRLADDVAAGDVKIQSDKFGRFFRTNEADGTKTPVTSAERSIIETQVSVAQQQAQDAQQGSSDPFQAQRPPGMSLEEAVLRGIGPWAGTKEFMSNVFGPFVPGVSRDIADTMEARQSIKVFRQTAILGFLNNERAPVHEQDVIRDFLPDVDKFFKDQEVSLKDLGILKNRVKEFKLSKQREIATGDLSIAREIELDKQVSQLNALLFLMEPPPEREAGVPRVSSREDIERLKREGTIRSGDEVFWEPTKQRGFVK